MDYQKEFIVDFAKRTRANLEFIEAAASDQQNVFEVTQLANSLLGLLVFPKEFYVKRIPKTPISELLESGWPDIKTTLGEPRKNLRELVRMLRNGIAHCNVEFLAESGDKQITGLKIWNSRPKQVETRDGKQRKVDEITWQAELSIADLRHIALKFIELIETGPTY